ncbi:MAG: DNA mismatch repair protein MutS [Bacteroidales bacterium]|nr:DNA mismatch repair protein MutS [Bacteroidales bacterium]
MAKKVVETPLMKQYNQIKSKHPDAVLLFRVGDFYETFSDDAIKASEILGITLTKRANGAASYVELAGFPYHALDTYLPKLVRAGQRVAICEQLEDPKKTKNIVKRGVTELVTPGVAIGDHILEHKENNFLASVHIEKQIAGISFLDLSTGEFYLAQGNHQYIDKLLSSFAPKEVLYERSKYELFRELFGTKYYTYKLEDWAFTESTSKERLLKQFDTKSLKGFGVERMDFGITAAGAILQYLDLTEHRNIKHITRISRIEEDKYVWLDKFTIRNLELFNSFGEDAKSLLDVIDKTVSPPGSRLMKRWLALPLKNLTAINERLDLVDFFISQEDTKEKLTKLIKQTGDLERMNSKIASQRISPRDVAQLKNALFAVEEIKEICQNSNNKHLKKISDSLNPCENIRDRIEREINEEPPTAIQKGNVIKNGVSEELDEYRKIAYSGKDYLENMKQELALKTGISSLKIGVNNVFGYYFEVRNRFKDMVPEEWTRKQTLVSSERYINQELKEYEEKILGAEDKIHALEGKLFEDLVISLADYIPVIQTTAQSVAKLDVLTAFANVSLENNYVKPNVNDSDELNIIQGRHPVIEVQLPVDEPYIPNDVFLDTDKQQIIIVTGPNMAGKSALLRQTALIVLMAQIGCFVPAESADIGYVDKVFTRVGASDNISSGESTFMVEMNEASSILNNLSERSLILFDELGRGTSTYDGISIAWSIVEYIHEHPKTRAKTLFATHYHELNEMEKSFERIKNFNVSVKEVNQKIIFLRKLVKGGSEHSFGIHVAKLAGMPRSIVSRANKILEELEQSHRKEELIEKVDDLAGNREGYQMSFFQLDDPVLVQVRDEIKNIDINNLTPMEALNKLNEIKKLLNLKNH